jgi:hypothetical protein
MAKKSKKKQEVRPIICNLQDLQLRPVTKKDTWCRFDKPNDDNPDAIYGYVASMPIGKMKRTIISGIEDGFIVRTKRFCNNFLLQIVFTYSANKHPQYGTLSGPRLVNKKSGRTRTAYSRCVRNLAKTEGRFEKRKLPD